MIMIVKTPGSQMGSPAAAEEGGEDLNHEFASSWFARTYIYFLI